MLYNSDKTNVYSFFLASQLSKFNVQTAESADLTP